MKFKRKIRRDTITRTIRFSGDAYDKICELAQENDISFNNVVNQMVEYVLDEEKSRN